MALMDIVETLFCLKREKREYTELENSVVDVVYEQKGGKRK